ncbi:MAG: PAS domain-containing protein [Parvibaculum sp.]|nr:PAS domain-containing protein [Parvibaculum sp.]
MDLAESQTFSGIGEDARRLMEAHAPSAGRGTAAPAFSPRALTDFFAYWSSLPRANGAPHATDFDPLALTLWLPDTTIMEIHGPGDIRFRLVGTRVAERMTHDPTGTNMLEMLAPETRAQVCRDMHEIAYRPCGYHARYVNVYGSGRVSHVQSLYLPLAAPVGHPPRMIAVHAPEEAVEYQQPADRTVCATSIDEIVWVDVGRGVPS